MDSIDLNGAQRSLLLVPFTNALSQNRTIWAVWLLSYDGFILAIGLLTHGHGIVLARYTVSGSHVGEEPRRDRPMRSIDRVGDRLTTGLFSLVDAAYLRLSRSRRPGEILTVTSIGDDGRVMSYDWADYEDMALAAKGLAELSAYSRRGALLKREEGTELVLAYPVSSNHFSFLGVRAALGRASLDPVHGRPAVVSGAWALAEEIRRRSWHYRQDSYPRQSALHRNRGNAEGVHRT